MTVAFDQLTVNSSDATAVTTLTINATSTGTQRLAIILLSSGGGDIDAGAAVTVGGDAAANAGLIDNRFIGFRYIAPPTASTAYVATWTNIVRCIMYVATFNGVRQSSPLPQVLTLSQASGATSSTLTFTSSVNGGMLLDIMQKLTTNEDITPGASQTEQSDTFYANNNMRQSLSTKPVTIASEVSSHTWATGNEAYQLGYFITPHLAGNEHVMWFMFKRWQGFLGELRRGLIPPHELRKRYGDLIAI